MLEATCVLALRALHCLAQLSCAYRCIGCTELPYLGSKFIGKDKDNLWVGSRNVDEKNSQE